jgi:hypothetical protein
MAIVASIPTEYREAARTHAFDAILDEVTSDPHSPTAISSITEIKYLPAFRAAYVSFLLQTAADLDLADACTEHDIYADLIVAFVLHYVSNANSHRAFSLLQVALYEASPLAISPSLAVEQRQQDDIACLRPDTFQLNAYILSCIDLEPRGIGFNSSYPPASRTEDTLLDTFAEWNAAGVELRTFTPAKAGHFNRSTSNDVAANIAYYRTGRWRAQHAAAAPAASELNAQQRAAAAAAAYGPAPAGAAIDAAQAAVDAEAREQASMDDHHRRVASRGEPAGARRHAQERHLYALRREQKQRERQYRVRDDTESESEPETEPEPEPELDTQFQTLGIADDYGRGRGYGVGDDIASNSDLAFRMGELAQRIKDDDMPFEDAMDELAALERDIEDGRA